MLAWAAGASDKIDPWTLPDTPTCYSCVCRARHKRYLMTSELPARLTLCILLRPVQAGGVALVLAAPEAAQADDAGTHQLCAAAAGELSAVCLVCAPQPARIPYPSRLQDAGGKKDKERQRTRKKGGKY
mgnify:CR=1 FL=1